MKIEVSDNLLVELATIIMILFGLISIFLGIMHGDLFGIIIGVFGLILGIIGYCFVTGVFVGIM